MGRALGAAACAREAGGGVPARVRGRGRGCAKYAGGQGAGRASDPGSPESDGRTAGGHTRENPGGPALRPRVEKLLVVPAGRSSRSPALSVRDQYSLPPKPASAGCVPHALVTAVTLKKNLLTFLFLTPAKILLRVPLAQFYSSKLWPCLCFPKTCLPPAFD